MSVRGTDEPSRAPLIGGRLLAEITNRIVALMREHYGRGPIKAKTYVLDNLIVCVLRTGSPRSSGRWSKAANQIACWRCAGTFSG